MSNLIPILRRNLCVSDANAQKRKSIAFCGRLAIDIKKPVLKYGSNYYYLIIEMFTVKS